MAKQYKIVKSGLLIFFFLILIDCTIANANELPYPSRADSARLEINNIIFTGTTEFAQEELKRVILTQETDLNLFHRGLRFLYEQSRINRYAPDFVKKNLLEAVGEWKGEFQFYKAQSIELDSVRVHNFYFQKGFHHIDIKIFFYGLKQTKKNTLEFRINPGKRWKFTNVVYYGLDTIALEVLNQINLLKKIKKDDDFDEYRLMNEISQIHQTLRSFGYYYSKFDQDPISIDTALCYDSVTVHFNPGVRQKIAKITFVDSLKDQAVVAMGMKRAQLKISEGDWYNPSKVNQSELNLYSLGTFDMVKIDTIGTYLNRSDSLLSLLINLQYRKQQNYGVALFLNQTSWNTRTNLGVEAYYTHTNAFNAAQVLNPYIRLSILDINNFFSKLSSMDLNSFFSNYSPIEREISIGINFSQPLLFTLDNSRVGFSFQPNYSQKSYNKYLKLETYSLPIRFPVRLPDVTYFQNVSIELVPEYQKPINFNNLDTLKNQTTNPDDKIAIEETISLYKNLNSYVYNSKPWMTANTIGFNIFGDTRDNPFSPLKGNFTSIGFDLINPMFLPFDKLKGIAKYIRFQMMYLGFRVIDHQSTLAVKGKIGYIYWWDKNTSYVPTDRQFFAGGANSVRGWSSRRLRYITNPEQKASVMSNLSTFAQDYIGNSTLIEGSIEWRFRFNRPRGIYGVIADQISNVGFTAFIDVGNAFQWLTVDSTGNFQSDYKWHYYITKLAIAAGIGLRYETPVGPLRLDFGWPIYDPMRSSDAWIFQRKNFFNTVQFHIALGHSF